VGSPKIKAYLKKPEITKKKIAPLKIAIIRGDKVGLNQPAGPSRYQTIRINF